MEENLQIYSQRVSVNSSKICREMAVMTSLDNLDCLAARGDQDDDDIPAKTEVVLREKENVPPEITVLADNSEERTSPVSPPQQDCPVRGSYSPPPQKYSSPPRSPPPHLPSREVLFLYK